MDIQKKLKDLPEKPGVYLMKDGQGLVIYVGKAVSLKRRVRSYFQKDFSDSPKTAAMVSKVRDLEWRLADSEQGAILMESNLIKKLRPRYNIELKDDKSYPYLMFTDEDYPRLCGVRRPYHGRGEYFGPFTATVMKATLRFIHELFPLRYCEGSLKTKKPCLYYEMKSCLAPCLPGKVPVEEYAKIVREVKLFLLGKKTALLAGLEKGMWEESDRGHYETAAKLRDKLAKAREFIAQQQAASRLIRKEGDMVDRPAATKGLEELQRSCSLAKLPRHIEAFDISHLSGSQTVASLVVFKDGFPSKKDYRKFKIKTVPGIDDFASMAEVVGRRYRRVLAEKGELPDLVLVDGGRGQLDAALRSLRRTGLDSLPVISLAKREEHIFTTADPGPVILQKNSAGLHLVQWIRDEAHRFAVKYHKVLRGREVSASALDRLSGIGPKRKQELLRRFGSVDKLERASLEEIQAMRGFSEKMARKVKGFLGGK